MTWPLDNKPIRWEEPQNEMHRVADRCKIAEDYLRTLSEKAPSEAGRKFYETIAILAKDIRRVAEWKA